MASYKYDDDEAMFEEESNVDSEIEYGEDAVGAEEPEQHENETKSTLQVHVLEVMHQLMNELEPRRLEHNGNAPQDPQERSKVISLLNSSIKRYIKNRKPNHLPLSQSLTKIRINDPVLSLLAAFEFARLYQISEVEKASTNFLKKLALKVKKEAGIYKSMPKNAILEAIQDYYDKSGFGCRIFLFTSSNGRTPIFRAPRKRRIHKESLGVFEDVKSHEFYAIKELIWAFSDKYRFCADCASTLETHKEYKHRKSCPLKCPSCCRYGYKFPCFEGNKRKCRVCNRTYEMTSVTSRILTHSMPVRKKVFVTW